MPSRATRQSRNRARNNRRRNRTKRSESPDNMKMLQEELRTTALKSGEKWDCPVCLETLDPKQFVFTKCSHKLCSKCFSDTRISKCPICREDMGKGDITPEWESESEEEVSIDIPTGVFSADNMDSAPPIIRDLFNLISSVRDDEAQDRIARHLNVNQRRFLQVASQEQRDSDCVTNLDENNIDLGPDKLFIAFDVFDSRDAHRLTKGFVNIKLEDYPNILEVYHNDVENLYEPVSRFIQEFVDTDIDGLNIGGPWIALPCMITNSYEYISQLCAERYIPDIYKLITRETLKQFVTEWIEQLYDASVWDKNVDFMEKYEKRFPDEAEGREYYRNSKKKLVTMNEVIAPASLISDLTAFMFHLRDYWLSELREGNFDNNLQQFLINLNEEIKHHVTGIFGTFGKSSQYGPEVVNNKSKYENIVKTFMDHIQKLCIVPPHNNFRGWYVTNVEQMKFTYDIDDGPEKVGLERSNQEDPDFITKYNLPNVRREEHRGMPTNASPSNR